MRLTIVIRPGSLVPGPPLCVVEVPSGLPGGCSLSVATSKESKSCGFCAKIGQTRTAQRQAIFLMLDWDPSTQDFRFGFQVTIDCTSEIGCQGYLDHANPQTDTGHRDVTQFPRQMAQLRPNSWRLVMRSGQSWNPSFDGPMPAPWSSIGRRCRRGGGGRLVFPPLPTLCIAVFSGTLHSAVRALTVALPKLALVPGSLKTETYLDAYRAKRRADCGRNGTLTTAPRIGKTLPAPRMTSGSKEKL